MAIDTVSQVLDIVGPPIYVYHEIVHNRHVVEEFTRQGVVFVDQISQVPPQATLVFSAHGVSPQIRNAAKARGCHMIDATCPLVTKVHTKAIRYAKKGYKLLLIGHAGHDEVVGTVGEAPDAFTIVESAQDVEKLTFTPEDSLAYLTQTTLSIDDANIIIKAIKQKYPQVKQPPTEDICYATTNRQHAVRDACKNVDAVLVVGSVNSSNSVRLTEIAKNDNTPAYLLDDKSELQASWFQGVNRLLITAGASAPEKLVQEIIDHLVQHHQGKIIPSQTIDEKMHFNLPVGLRILKRDGSPPQNISYT